MGDVIRMAVPRAARQDDGGAPATRRGERRYRYPGPDVISEISHRSEPRRQPREPKSRRPEACRG